MTARDDAEPGLPAAGVPPEEAAARTAARGDITGAAICRLLGFYDVALEAAGWDSAPVLWCIERHAVSPGAAGLAGAGAWRLRTSSGHPAASALRGIAAMLATPPLAGVAQRCDLVAWVLAEEGWLTPLPGAPQVPGLACLAGRGGRAEARTLTAADRAGLRYQLVHPRGGAPVMFVADGTSSVRIAGAVPDALAELALAMPVPGAGG